MELWKCIVLLLLNILGVLHTQYYVQATHRDTKLFLEDDDTNEVLDPIYGDEYPEDICEDPRPPKNGQMQCGKSRTLKEKYICKAKCKKGNVFPNGENRGKLICDLISSEWSPKNKFPNCEKEIKCDPPCINGGKCEEQDVCTCPPRYSGDGCEIDNCEEPATPSNGNISCTISAKNTNRVSCKAECNPGFEFPTKSTKETYSCDLETGTWTSDVRSSVCERICTPLCQNGGVCSEGNKCICTSQYRGDKCEIESCKSPPTPTYGKMSCNALLKDKNSFMCIAECSKGYEFPNHELKKTHICKFNTGKWSPMQEFPDCEHICDPPCQNGGKCVFGNKCDCPENFDGDRCNNGICYPPCQNGGKCVSGNKCDCPENFEGDRCDIDICDPPCQNGGKCVTGNKCDCPQNFKGDRCNNIDICNPPCQNGGKCVSGNKCDCPQNFKGDTCNIGIPPIPSVLKICPEVPRSLKRRCRMSCPDGSACDGSHCVSIESCPCFKNGRFFNQSSEIRGKDCEQCICLPGGYTSCEPIKCPDCSPGQDAEMDSNCDCTCTGCPSGTSLCPTNGQCMNEDLCNGVVNCPDDDLGCNTVNGTSCSTDNVPDTDACEILGNTIQTFDGIPFQYDVCNHVLMKESESEKYSVTAHKTCPTGGLESCYQELVINVDGNIIKFGPGIDVINFRNVKVPAVQLWMVSKREPDIEMKQIGNSLLFRSLKYHFDVTWNKAEAVKITVSKCLFDEIVGLCGFYNRKYKDDFKMPTNKITLDSREFGNSWAIGSLDICKPPRYSREIKKIANVTCSKLNETPFKSCSNYVDMEGRSDACVKFMKECLQRSDKARHSTLNGKASSVSELNECKCQAFESFVEACEIAKDSPVKEWRMQHDCSSTCPEGMVWMECGPGCNLTCDNYHQHTHLCSSKCVPGCYCPTGLVLQQNQCVKPKMCHDCVCRGFGDPNYITFDGRYYAFQGTCTYVLAQHEISEESTRNFKVLATNVECPEEPGTSCIEALTIHWNGHIIEKEKNKPVFLDKKRLDPEASLFDQSWISIIYEPNKRTLIHIKEINLVVRYFDLMYGYTIELPSFFYFNKTEGLCGICNFIESDDLYHRDGYISNDIEEFAYSWLEGPKIRSNCEFPKVEPPPPPPPGLCNFTANSCEILLDPTSYAKSCLNDVQHSHTPKSSMCRSKFQFAQLCCEKGVPLTEWLKLSGCESSCPDGMEYKCTSACLKTCENYKTYKEDSCSLTPMFSCICPEGEVMKSGECVKTIECETCDLEGHVIGDKWQKGPCETCECLSDLSTSCTVEQCAGPPVCDSTEQIQKLPLQEGSCCDNYKCVPPTLQHCRDPKLKNCPPGTANVIDNSGDCPVYKCKCFLHLCPPTVIPFLEEGESYTTVTRDCCPEIEIECNSKDCPRPPTCNRGFKLSVQEGRCCNKFECISQNKVCIYQHKYRVDNGDEEELPLEGYYDMEYEPGSSWQDGLCRKCSCSDRNGQLGFSCKEETCPDPNNSPDAKKYVIEGEHVPGSCCLKYKRTRCISKGVQRRIGEKWEIPEGKHCWKIHSCNFDQDGEAVMHTTFRCESDCQIER